MPAWLHLDWFLFGALAGSAAVSVFWCWAIERREQAARGRERWQSALVSEQDAQLRGLYQQTSRLAELVVHHASAPEAPRRACRVIREY